MDSLGKPTLFTYKANIRRVYKDAVHVLNPVINCYFEQTNENLCYITYTVLVCNNKPK